MERYLNPITWGIVAAVFATLEVLAPGVFMIWLAGAAVGAAAIAALGGGAAAQMIGFALLAPTAVLAGRKWYRRHAPPPLDPELNRLSVRMVGQIVTVIEPLARDSGRVRVGDGAWPARGPALGVGAQAKVVAIDGSTLVVEAAELGGRRPEIAA